MIERIIQKRIKGRLFKGKTIILIGARQVGKTTLIREVLKGKDFLFPDGDDSLIRQQLTDPNTKEIETIIGGFNIVFIDKVQ